MEPTGLSNENRSTALDYAKLARHLLSRPVFSAVTTLKEHTVTTLNNNRKRLIRNTNRILGGPFLITGSKTGFTPAAGRCLLVCAKNEDGREGVAIVMGANRAGMQWQDMDALLRASLGTKTTEAPRHPNAASHTGG